MNFNKSVGHLLAVEYVPMSYYVNSKFSLNFADIGNSFFHHKRNQQSRANLVQSDRSTDIVDG